MSRGLPTVLVAMVLIGAPLTRGAAQVTATPAFQSPGIVGSGAANASQPPADIGTSASEVLSGNGTRAGYVLGHGNIIPESETVCVGVRRANKNVDYTIDYSSGSLFFTEAVDAMGSVHVDYRYTEGSKSARTLAGPGMLLKFGSQTQANLTYSYQTADQTQGVKGSDILTYGASTTSKFGGSSSISSMLYVATPQSSGRVSLTSTPAAGTQDAKTVKQDQMMVQNADLGLGILRFKIGYQNVGEDFAGFNALRDSGAGQTDLLNQLEKEKGLRRLDLSSELKVGGDGALSFSRGTIEDKQGDIATQSMGYSGTRMWFGFSTREVAKTFSRFNDLKEADRLQMANEVGLSRSQYFLQFHTFGAQNSPGGWSSFTSTTLSGENGELTYRAANVDLGRLKFQADARSATPKFDDMKAVNDDERARMALAARQQFDPNAQAGTVVAADKAQVGTEAGLDRTNYRALCDVGPLWLSLARSNVISTDGGISRTDYIVKHSAFTLHFAHHRIDPGFDRMASLQPTELRYFGNEHGMTRTDMDGQFKLANGNLDVTHKRVVDQQGATVSRDKFDFKTTGGEFHGNVQSIDPRFSRLADLSDADRDLLVQELGFKRSDYSMGITAVRNLKINSYFYDSTNVTANQARSQRKHEITYTSPRGLKITGLTDDFSYMSETGNMSSYSHHKVSFDNKFNVLGGLLFQGLNDVNTNQEGSGDPVGTQVSQTHIETNPGGKASFTMDSLQMDLGKGRFENTSGLGFKRQTSKRIALLGSFSRTDRNEKPEANATMGVAWSMGKNMDLKLNVVNRDGGPEGSRQSHQFSFNGTVANKRLGFENVKIGSGVNTTQLAGKQTGCDNAFKAEGKFIGGDFTVDNSDKLNPLNGIYYSSRLVKYDKDVKNKYHVSYYRQDLITPTNEFAKKRNYAVEAKLNSRVSTTATSYFGKDGLNGAVLPVGGGVFKLNYKLPGTTTMFTDYSADVNETTHRRARTVGVGFLRTLRNGSNLELYWGWSHLTESPTQDFDTVFRVKYDQKMDAAHYLTVSAQKRSAVDKSIINPYEGNITANLEFRTVFH